MLNWYLRYEPFLRVLESRQAADVLDVGSGWHGLSRYWPHPVVQTDLNFAEARPADAGRGQAVFVRSSADRLPFANGSFDFALSSDLLEHLPAGLRAPSVAELTRVARRGVLIGFPAGSAALLDRVFARQLRRRGAALPTWLQEHLEQPAYPDRETVAGALPDGWQITAAYPNGNVLLSAAVGLAETWGRTANLPLRLERRLAGRRLPRVTHLRPVVRVIYLLEPTGQT